MVNKLTVPTVHLNGSGKKNLTQGFRAAYEAVEAAIAALQSISPHGRDYYVQGEGALVKAICEHVERLKKLESVRDEIFSLYEAVEDQ